MLAILSVTRCTTDDKVAVTGHLVGKNLNEGESMKQLSVNERLEMLMARRTATKALKFITTNHQKHTMEYEIVGEL